MPPEAMIVVASGGRRYAVAQREVSNLRRDPHDGAPSLSAVLGAAEAQADDMIVSTVAGASVRVAQADLHGALPRLDLPSWLVPQVHPAVIGVVVHNSELLPCLQLGLLDLRTGHNAA